LLERLDHAAAACLAALEQQSALARLNAMLLAEGQMPFSALMGLTTGPMVVGNIGAETRLNYTVMGDAVNLASRLVAVNKIYQTAIIVGEQTALAAAGAVECRNLDRVTVPGRSVSLSIFEVMGAKGSLSDQQRRGRDLFEAGLSLYFIRDFQKALGQFEETLSFIQGDGPAELMSGRCRQYLLNQPGDDWDGVTKLAVK
jgi:adenylate cyclase